MLRSLFARQGLSRTAAFKPRLSNFAMLRHASAPAAPAEAQPDFSAKTVSLDRELPDPFADKKKNKKYFLLYGVGVAVSCAIIFNYEKTQSPIINSVLYCLRRSEEAKLSLGPNIGFASSWPWVWGELNAVKGIIDVEFKVKGDKQVATLKLKANRENKLVPFEVKHIYLEYPDGKQLDLRNDPSIDFEF
ncbi:hypothetical protein METBIDRAFT_38284 [Metschnikowia bicuspidata var. bicuspidata NRRL YB-4993]|uniref:DUF1783-domain-containing protein n=1 Tax=Metschnikowia bicuspidata var. bicuspidata NRRL YB-4993 TaxID=869754 RepID=A0A1A0HG71_9ASCO|nr:hypothetical protein METBIDRAFT_38284 [Metschnikowia bicuspidata var. bicuspidata NRRL YB-4993]OBA23164.1 hypothetical protein METBIDRAFT_38284 [Metschnikowia bicuspidata var. bicuspidata NRRL YB-4993]